MDHLLQRLVDPFNPESRFYWPLVIGIFLAIAANVVWYSWPSPSSRASRRAARAGLDDTLAGVQSPDEKALRPWAMWINVIFLIWLLVLMIAKVPFWAIVLSLVVDLAILGYMYVVYLPPKEAAWVREQRRLRYIPKPERRKRRR